MHFFTVLTSALTLGSSAASLLPAWANFGDNGNAVFPDYPQGSGCLNDKQANYIAEKFRQILANTDRDAAKKVAKLLIADGYTETSDSINILIGSELGATTFNKDSFINGALSAPGMPGLTTLRVFHDCNKISWQWRVTGLGNNKYPVKGINVFVVNPSTGVINSADLEFNSVAWGIDINAITCTFNQAQQRPKIGGK